MEPFGKDLWCIDRTPSLVKSSLGSVPVVLRGRVRCERGPSGLCRVELLPGWRTSVFGVPLGMLKEGDAIAVMRRVGVMK